MNDAVSSGMQATLRNEIEICGTGIFTGCQTVVKVFPAPANTGIVFQRVDLENSPQIPAKLSSVHSTLRCTCLGSDTVQINMVEHLLSALYACGIDNARIEINGPEIPILDGSSQKIVNQIMSVGLKMQDVSKCIYAVKEPIFWSEQNVHLIALPSSTFKISYTLHYPQSNLIGSQYYSYELTPDSYYKEIAPSRTFSFYDEIILFRKKGLIKGGGLENAVIISEDRVLNPEGTRFANEMVRHKILDLIGDLSLIGVRLLAHVIAICSGHRSNVAFAKVLDEQIDKSDFAEYQLNWGKLNV